MACPKQKTVREINDKIRSQKYGFSGRITKIIDGRMMIFFDKEDGSYYQRYKDDIIILSRSIRI